MNRAEWDPLARQLHLALDPMNDAVVGQPTSMVVSGLEGPTAFKVISPDGARVESQVRGSDLVIRTQVGRHALLVAPD
jgi:hypothetical protein